MANFYFMCFMTNMNRNISFTSHIKPVPFFEFNSLTRGMSEKSYVPYPWTLNESVLNEDVFTKSVQDCSVYIISNGQKAKMLHICPDCSDAKNFERIAKSIEEDFDMDDENLEAFIIGGKAPYLIGNDSYELFDKFVEFSNKHNIPTTILKGGMGEKSIAYFSQQDTLYVSNTQRFFNENNVLRMPIDILRNWFDKVVIHSKDRVTM